MEACIVLKYDNHFYNIVISFTKEFLLCFHDTVIKILLFSKKRNNAIFMFMRELNSFKQNYLRKMIQDIIFRKKGIFPFSTFQS